MDTATRGGLSPDRSPNSFGRLYRRSHSQEAIAELPKDVPHAADPRGVRSPSEIHPHSTRIGQRGESFMRVEEEGRRLEEALMSATLVGRLGRVL